jgi:enoyl-[acyl-carrier protein] reductase II
MNFHTPICDLLGIEHPILLAGMGGVSYADVVAAVSNAGGFGTLGMASAGPDQIREQMQLVKEQTDKPFGVDLLTAVPESLKAACDIIIEEGASAFIAGLGVPEPIMPQLKEAGIKVATVCGAVRHAVKAEQAGCDFVIAQGTEGGGHTGRIAGMALIPQMVDAVSIPVIAAGAIYDGRGLAASLAYGAQGVWVGTRFIASTEARAGMEYKDAILGATDQDTIVTRCYTGKTLRTLRNPYVDDWERRPDEIQPFPAQAMHSAREDVLGGIGGKVENLDPQKDCLPMGQGAGGIGDVLPAAEIIQNMLAEAQQTIGGLQRFA